MLDFDGYSLSHNNDGTITFLCSPRKPGKYRILVEWNDVPLDGLPLQCSVVLKDDNSYETIYELPNNVPYVASLNHSGNEINSTSGLFTASHLTGNGLLDETVIPEPEKPASSVTRAVETSLDKAISPDLKKPASAATGAETTSASASDSTPFDEAPGPDLKKSLPTVTCLEEKSEELTECDVTLEDSTHHISDDVPSDDENGCYTPFDETIDPDLKKPSPTVTCGEVKSEELTEFDVKLKDSTHHTSDDVLSDDKNEVPFSEEGGTEDIKKEVTHSEKRAFPCSHCDKSFSLLNRLRRHERAHSSEKPHACTVEGCEKKYKSFEALKQHRHAVHGLTTPSRKLPKRCHLCPVCGKSFMKASRCTSHMMTHSNERAFMCDICGKSLKTREVLQKHISEMHPPIVPMEVGTTGDGATATERPRPFLCTYCGKTFLRRGQLRIHVAAHKSTVQLGCPFEGCTKSFPTQHNLNNHIRCVHPQTMVQCSVCDKQFKRQTYLNKHMMVHNGVLFPCTEPNCDRQFASKGNLLQHTQRMHRQMTREFVCTHDVCGKKFKSKFELTNHMQSHSEERNFECKVCHKSFKRRSTLHSHYMCHSKKKHQCPDCDKSFTRRSHLQKHIRRHQIDNPPPTNIGIITFGHVETKSDLELLDISL